MRQAGRYLPGILYRIKYRNLLTSVILEFREVRKDHEFFDICRTPTLATEITLQPIRRYSGLVDAAIIFSDILVIPQAMGMEVLMNPGPHFPEPLETPADVSKLSKTVDVDKELGYVFEAITMTRKGLNGQVPLIGFSGAPWTLFAYMIEGGGSKTLQKSKTWLFKYPEESKALIMRIADVCVDYLVGQVKAGAQVSIALSSYAILTGPRSYSKCLTHGLENFHLEILRHSLFLPSYISRPMFANELLSSHCPTSLSHCSQKVPTSLCH